MPPKQPASRLGWFYGVGILVIILGVAGYTFRRYISPVIPALAPASGDIAKDIEHANEVSTDTSATAPVRELPLTMPDGVSLRVFAKGLSDPRDLDVDPNGHVMVSVPNKGTVVYLNEQTDGTAKPTTLVSGLNQPHGLAFSCEDDGVCLLFVAATDAVYRFDYDSVNVSATNKTKILDLPTGGRHITRSLFAHDNKLFISIGSSCDVCHESDERRGTIMVSEYDGTNARVYAKGLRNSVFIAHSPTTHQLWATDMGRDNLGDNIPPDEVNIVKDGGNYGWPNCYGNNIHDTAFDKNTYIRNPCMAPFETPAHIEFPAHSAPLGLAFFPKEWPEEYRDDLLVAFHGSWNRSVPDGYKLERVKLDAKGNVGEQDNFVTGWLNAKNQASGRPVDVLFRGKDLFVSDDKSGVVYRFTAP
ncbi:MAG: PQQ-dependent sugar dehydrogenase [Patescibacteria group bacterium]